MTRRLFEGDTSRLAQATLDTLPLNVAILNTEGEILATNQSWQEFAVENDLAMQPDTVGVNYLEVCDNANDETALEAAAGIRDIIAGDRDVFSLEYPCHSPDEQRWFILRATRFIHDHTPYISVVHSNITDRKQAELAVEQTAEELADERETLALLNQIVRHDIRNDAHAIAGWAGLLTDSVDSDAAETIQRIETTASQMVELTHTAADLTETVAEDTTEDLRPINLTDTLQTQLDKLSHQDSRNSKQIVIEDMDLPTDLWVLADEMLSSVFSNILNNAVFHSHTDPVEVSIAGEWTGDRDTVTVCIADNGPGIPDAAKDRVFGRGEKGLASTGTGLGLYLVDRLMERYNGSVELADNTPTGTIVRLTFQGASRP